MNSGWFLNRLFCLFVNIFHFLQVAIAALDQARHDLAIDCIQQLHKRFPKSTRVTKLQAMRLEALGNYDDAEELYTRLIEADETNPVRQIVWYI